MTPDDIVIGLKANSKKQVLQEMVRRIAETIPELDQRAVLDQILERERLGCTGIGDGVAIPHARCAFPAELRGTPIAMLALLEKPVDYQSNDEKPVDIVFMLLAPENPGGEHLTALALASRILRVPARASELRGCTNSDAVWTLLNSDSVSNAA
ncbi:PTS sugar transporter subunit IIA [Alphaproteobacteria bacterium LSUCC0684]